MRRFNKLRHLICPGFPVLVFFLFFMMPLTCLYSQSSANYTFASSSSGSLAADANSNTVNMSSGTTQLIAASVDDGASPINNIGFDFWLLGTRYTQFSASSNGAIALGNIAISSSIYTLPQAAPVIIAPFMGNQKTSSSGKVHYKIVGSAPSRTLVIEFLNMGMNNSSTGANGTYQLRLYEGTGVIEFVYGAMAIGSGTNSYYIGFSSTSSNTKWATVVASTGAVTTSGSATSNTSVSSLTSSSNGSRVVYTFSPVIPSAPNTSSFASVTATGTKIQWKDNSSNEYYFQVQYSTDNINYSLLTLVASATSSTTGTSYSYTASGLISGTKYYYKVYAVSEGGISSALLDSQATTSGSLSGTKIVGPSAGADYSTLTAAISAIKTNGLSGALILELQSTYVSTSETFPIAFSGLGATATNSITVRPASGASSLSISGSSSTAVIEFSNEKYVTIDGRAGGTGSTKVLTIANTSTSGPAIRFINEGILDTVKYCTIKGVATSISVGVILFSTTTGYNGNDYNVIDNCDVGDGSSTPTICIYSSGSSAIDNDHNTISNCNIYNFYSASAGEADGIKLSSSSGEWTIKNNSFYQTSSRTPTSALIFYPINISNASTGNGFLITGNYIGGSSAQCGGSALTISGALANKFYCSFSFASLTASNITYNKIANIAINSNTAISAPGIFCGIYLLGGYANIDNNIIGARTGTGSISMVYNNTSSSGSSFGIYSSSTANTSMSISNNVVGSITPSCSTSTVSHSFQGISIASATSSTTYTINNNSIGSTATSNSINASTSSSASVLGQSVIGINNSSSANITIANDTVANLNNNYSSSSSLGQTIGILSSAGQNTITGNKVFNLSSTTTETSTGASAAIIGICHSSTGTISYPWVSQNIVYGLSETASSGAISVIGIYYTGPTSASSGNDLVDKNFIHSLNASSTSAVINGLQIAGGNASTQNNMIRLGIDASGNSITTAHTVNGINETGGNNNFYFNSIYIGGSGVGTTTSNSYAFVSSISSNPRIYENNIFVNTRSNSSGTGGKHFAIKIAGVGNLTCNYNLYLSNGTGSYFGAVSSSNYSTFTAWKSANALFDSRSVNDDPQFINPTGSTASLSLHIPDTLGTKVEASGINIGSVSDDFDGDSRSSYTPVDIGADCGNFKFKDVLPPTITLTPLGSTASTANRTLATMIKDSGLGLDTSGIKAPHIYFRKNSFGSWASSVASLVSGNNFTFDLDYSLLGGISAGDTVFYYVAAQDKANTPNPNVTTSPSGGSGDSPPGSTVPATLYSYRILAQLTPGNYYVGTSSHSPAATFATIGQALADYNSKFITGAVNFILIDTAYNTSTGETFPFKIYPNLGATSSNKLTIKPEAGNSVRISGADPLSIFIFKDASYITIDGSNSGTVSRDIIVTNSNASAIIIDSGASNITIKNSYLETTGSMVYAPMYFKDANSSTGCSYDSVLNCDINAGNGAFYGVMMSNTAYTVSGVNNVIKSCTIHDFIYGGIVADGFGYYSGIEISGNEIYETNPNSTIFGSLAGIYVGENTNAIISKNNIHNIDVSTSAVNNLVYGIWIDQGISRGSTRIENNFINLGDYTGSYGEYIYGIMDLGNSGSTVGIYYNTVRIAGAGVADGSSHGYYKYYASSTILKNNNFYNIRTNGAGLGIHSAFGISSASFTSDYNNFYVDNTGGGYLLDDGSGTCCSTLSGWQTAYSQDANSLNKTTTFVSSSDLHISSLDPCPMKGKGVVISSITKDIDGDNRGTSPDIGADQYPGTSKGLWMGGASSDWLNVSNWCSGSLPTDSDDVVINSSKPHYPVIGSAALTPVAKDVFIASGGSLTINGGKLTVYGNIDLIAGGTWSHTSGDLSLAATSGIQTCKPLSYFNVEGNGATIYLGGAIINGSLTLNGGRDSIGNNIQTIKGAITLNSGAVFTGGTGSSLYILGTSGAATIPTVLNGLSVLKTDRSSGVTLSGNQNIFDTLLLNDGLLDLNSYNLNLPNLSNIVRNTGSISTAPTIIGGGSLINLIYKSGVSTGYEMPLQVNDIDIIASGTVTLSSDLNVKGELMLSSGTFHLGSHKLTLGAGITTLSGSLGTSSLSDIEISDYTGIAPMLSLPPISQLHNFKMNRIAGASITGNLGIANSLDLGNGVLNTDNTSSSGNIDTVFLGSSASLSNESDSSYIRGRISTERLQTNDGVLNSFGNIGTEIAVPSTGNDPVSIKVTRSTGVNASNSSSNICSHYGRNYVSIDRTYHIEPANNGGLNASLVLHYLDGELNGIPESGLNIFRKPENGSVFFYTGTDTRNSTNNTLAVGTTRTVDSFSKWTAGGYAAPLPVTLVKFDAELIDEGSSRLIWETVSEMNNDHFEIERSTDGINFTHIGEVKGLGTNNSFHKYEFTDQFGTAILTPVMYYRLKQVDANGAYSNSEIRKVYLSPRKMLNAWYDKVDDKFRITFDLSGDEYVSIRLIDIMGRVVATRSLHLKKGNNVLQLDAQGLSKGVYLLEQLNGTIETNKKIIKY